jgi:putative zinc finger/helix-turn-helix YgiT family protein
MAVATIPYDTVINHDGRSYEIHIPNLSAPQCSNCGEISFDVVADREIDEFFRNEVKLLTPNKIREERERLGLTQKELAQDLEIAVETLSRWENGSQIQQRAFDKLLRGYFENDAVRAYYSRSRLGVLSRFVQNPEPINLSAINTVTNLYAVPGNNIAYASAQEVAHGFSPVDFWDIQFSESSKQT